MARGNNGRGRGRGNNNGGRGGGRGSGGNNNSEGKKSKIIFTPPGTEGVKNPPSFNKVKERLMEKIMKVCQYGHDIRDSIQVMERIDLDQHMPIRKVSTDTDPVVKAAQDETYGKLMMPRSLNTRQEWGS